MSLSTELLYEERQSERVREEGRTLVNLSNRGLEENPRRFNSFDRCYSTLRRVLLNVLLYRFNQNLVLGISVLGLTALRISSFRDFGF